MTDQQKVTHVLMHFDSIEEQTQLLCRYIQDAREEGLKKLEWCKHWTWSKNAKAWCRKVLGRLWTEEHASFMVQFCEECGEARPK